MEPRAKTLIERLGFRDADRKNSRHDEIQYWVYKNLRIVLQEVFPDKLIPDLKDIPVKLEYAVTERNYNRNYVVGFVDIYCERFGIAIEIKTDIPVVGDLIRQINFYRNFLNSGTWIVVCPNRMAAPMLRDQDIKFYHYRSQNYLNEKG